MYIVYKLQYTHVYTCYTLALALKDHKGYTRGLLGAYVQGDSARGSVLVVHVVGFNLVNTTAQTTELRATCM